MGAAIWAAGLGLSAAPLPAQTAPDAGGSTPAADAIGPKELQNFSLSGTVTRPADQPQAAASAPTRAPAQTSSSTGAARPASQQKAAPVRAATTEVKPSTVSGAASSSKAVPPPVTPVSSLNSTTTPIGTPGTPLKSSAGFAPAPESPTGTLAPEHGILLWPWLLAALALGAGGAFLFWRARSRETFAGGPQIDLFTAPEPAPAPPPRAKAPEAAPAPVPTPPPQPHAPPIPSGVVSTRLRPWLEVAMVPGRCIVEETQVVFEFELELFNSGNAPARAILVEASVFNAGPTQEQDIGAFFARPIGEGERIDTIPPLQRMTMRTQVVAPRDNVQALEIAARQVFVPLIAFNALYRWNASEGQTSVSYLLGRDTKGEKMAPFRLDLGPRVFRNVGARELPMSVRN